MTLNKSPKIIFLFSGQGSHYREMGAFLYRNYSCFSAALNQSDTIIKEYIGQSISKEIYENKDRNFNDLLITHPAIVAIELAMLDLMEALGIEPDYVVGNSLGEFAAAVAAGIWTKERALEAAIEQAKSIIQEGEEGGMLTIINESKVHFKPLLEKNQLYVASENFQNHFTISGLSADLNAFEEELKKIDTTFLRLSVAYPFHSPFMEAGKTGFQYYTSSCPPLNGPSKKFISGLYPGRLDYSLPENYFWRVISEPTNFSQLVDFMEGLGECLYLDLGPSGTMASFVKYNLDPQSNSTILPIMTPFKREAVQLKSLQTLLK